MTTMRPLLRRVELTWIAFLLVGALCGALAMFGVDALRQSSHDATAPLVAAPVQAPNSVPLGGRLGGISSSDTATSWYLLHEFNPVATTLSVAGPAAAPSVEAPLGEGFIGSHDRAVDAVAVTPRIVGPGERLNTVSDGSSTIDSIPPIIDPAKGLNPKR